MTNMKNALTRMQALLKAGLASTGTQDRHVTFNQDEMYFTLGDSGVEVAFEIPGKWRVREIYMFADLEEGGERPIGATIAEARVGDEVEVAKAAIMRMIEVRIDSGLDSIA